MNMFSCNNDIGYLEIKKNININYNFEIGYILVISIMLWLYVSHRKERMQLQYVLQIHIFCVAKVFFWVSPNTNETRIYNLFIPYKFVIYFLNFE